mmetsp:Transcript_34751/g.103091  ORF Transcript_34751/g.103091 Transcript_34751/m.103091 type:complete len:275 (-) Transcript_34751:317-1141(-)
MALAMKTISARGAGRASSAGVPRVAAPRVAGVRSLPVRHVRAAAMGQGEAQMKALVSRWESQVEEGRVVSVSGSEAGQMMKEGWTLLDVRPPGEANKVPIVGSVQVPLFVEDNGTGLNSIMGRSMYFGSAGGWWSGGTHLVPNPDFLAQVQAQIPKDAKIVVACQKGLRSLAACEQLSRAGYGAGMAWINGGCDTCRKGDIPTKDDMDPRYAGIGGLSEVLGWNDVQREENKQLLGGSSGVINFFIAILAIDVLVWLVQGIQEYQQTGVFRIHL